MSDFIFHGHESKCACLIYNGSLYKSENNPVNSLAKANGNVTVNVVGKR